MTTPALRARFEALRNLPATASRREKQRRGYDFERLLNDLLDAENLSPRLGYKPVGEQIDGSLVLDGRVFLLEAKWHAEPLAASSLYAFQGKVRGKLVGTVGVFISASGFSDDAAEALTHGKEIDVVLWDMDDLEELFVRGKRFRELLVEKLRAAAEEGIVRWPPRVTQVNSTTGLAVVGSVSIGQVGAVAQAPTVGDLRLLFVEGVSTVVLLQQLTATILERRAVQRAVQIIPAAGWAGLPGLLDELDDLLAPALPPVAVVIDASPDPAVTARLREDLRSIDPRLELFVADPSIEAWLEEPPPAQAAETRQRFESFLVDELPGVVDRYAEEIRHLLEERVSYEEINDEAFLSNPHVLGVGSWGSRADASTTELVDHALRDVTLVEVVAAERDAAVAALRAVVDAEFRFPVDMGEAWEASEAGELSDLVSEDEEQISGYAQRKVRVDLSLTAEYDPVLRELRAFDVDGAEYDGPPDEF